MSGNDDQEPGGELVQFPRVFMPGSFDAPDRSETGPADDDGDQAPLVGTMPRLPGVESMAPPLALTMPGVPTPDDGDDGDGGDGEFAPPLLDDPDNPTTRGTLALAMALMTAMGVAAAQGMWHRARHRQALADQSRAAADRTKAAAGGRATRSTGGSGSLLRSPSGGGGSKGSRAFGSHRPTGHRPTGHGAAGHDSTGRSRKTRPPGVDAAHGPHRPHKRDKGGSGSAAAPKAGRSGKPVSDGKPVKGLKDKLRKVKGGVTQKSAPGATAPGGKPAKQKQPKKPSSAAAPVPRLTWKAPKEGGKAAKGPKRWTRQPGTRSVPTAKRPSTKGTAKRIGQARKVTWKAQKGGTGKGPKRWTPKPPSSTRPGGPRPRKATKRKTWKATKTRTAKSGAKTGKRWTAESGTAGGTDAGQEERQARASAPPPPPPPGFEGMRPPPAADRTVHITVEQVDDPAPPPSRPAPRALTQEGTRPMLNAALPSTQYRDAELTIFDVIDSAADMAEEIVDGVTEAQRTAKGCDLLLDRLEALHAKVVELRVPGALEGMVVALMEQTAVVKARAEAIAENLPRAAEAISIAGSNAEARHRPLADAVRDAGHTRPAEREYHNE
ncbi:hypothetical protein ACWEU6_21970 [Streptosporangium sandarakinum]